AAGWIAGDVVTVASTGTFDTKHAGTGKTVNLSATSYGGADNTNYSITDQVTASAAISKANLVITSDDVTKTYDGTVIAEGSASATSGTQMFVDDSLTGGTYAFTNAHVSRDGSGNVLNNKTVTTTGVTVNDDNNGNNYAVTYADNITSTINPQALSLVLANQSKTYDGSTNAPLDTTDYSLTGFIGTEDASVTQTVGTYDSKNVLDATNVTAALTSNDFTADALTALSDYVLPITVVAEGSITTATLTAVADVQDRTYDATNVGTLNDITLQGLIGSETLRTAQTTGGDTLFGDKNVGVDKTVTVTGITINNGTGVEAGLSSNYQVASTATTKATISKKDLTVKGVVALDKVYDGKTTAQINTSIASLDGAITDDLVSIGSMTGSFLDKNAGDNKVVNGSEVVLLGADGGNYNLIQPTGLQASITQRALTVSISSTDDKVYDSATDAIVTLADDRVSGDQLSYVYDANFIDKNVGNNKFVSVSNISLTSSADLTNYTVNSTASGFAAVTAKAITISGITAGDKTYDANTAAIIDVSSAAGWINGDDVTVAATGVFATKDAGTDRTVALSSSYSGADESNYVITHQSTTTGDVTAKAITISGITAGDKTYDANTAATIDVSRAAGWISGDDVTVASTGAFATKDAGTDKTVALNSSYSGADESNYVITHQSTTTGDVTAKAITVSGITAGDKTYDANTVATIDVSGAAGWISGDDVTVAATGAFDTKNVGTDKTVALSSSYGGADESNYVITHQSTTTGDVTAKAVAISGITAGEKTYDANTVATIDVSSAAGWISGDDVTVAATGAFDTKDVGTDKTVALSSSYGGADESNYVITHQSTTTGDVTAKAITVSGITAGDKTYDANTAATIDVSSAAGWISGDDVTVAATGAFATKDAGTDKTVVLSSSYGGADESNYVITHQSTTTGDVTAKAITVSGITAGDKTYDANTVATIDVSSAAGWISGDDVTVAATGAFDTKDVGTDKTVALSSSYGGADESNYVITDQSITMADVQSTTTGNVLLNTIVTDVVNTPTSATGDVTSENINSSAVNRSGFGSNATGMMTGLMTDLMTVADAGISGLQAKDEEDNNGE
ncbi:hypothetical protein H4J59_15565, partial [Colwellia sp. MB02u-10]|uniref:beta strand repeat-containing protein n=1 Tax=Colwellia sp. MB02u-10 TaxID=2759828 RepID=UPI0018452AC2